MREACDAQVHAAARSEEYCPWGAGREQAPLSGLSATSGSLDTLVSGLSPFQHRRRTREIDRWISVTGVYGTAW